MGGMPELSTEAAAGGELAAAHVFPLGSRVNGLGHLEVGGCDVVELVAEYGTPAYIYAEEDMRSRARAYVEAGNRLRPDRFEVLFASKAFPCTAAYRLFAEEGLSVDIASGGELHTALAAGIDPDRIYMHGNNKTERELRYAIESGVGHLILDSFDEIARLEAMLERTQRVLIRVTPGIKPSTHSYIQTGQVDSKFGFGIESGAATEAIARVRASARLDLVGLHAHIGSQIFELEPFALEVAALAEIAGDWCQVLNIGGGLGVAYTDRDQPPGIAESIKRILASVSRHFPETVRVLVEPGRSLVANAGITAYRIGTRKEIPGLRTYVAVDGGMSDNLRPMLYGSEYHAVIADRAAAPGTEVVTVAGMHCESGDILVRDAELAAPAVGDVLVTAATGAYGHAMANNYNGIPRPPVIFCRGGKAEVVVRRETYDDLLRRDV